MIYNKPLDRKRQPCLWYSQSIVDFFGQVDFGGRKVLEFGAGHSTLYWSERAESVVAIEDNKEWYEYLRAKIGENVELEFVDENCTNHYASLEGRKFDLIIIDCDGGPLSRVKSAEWACSSILPGGAILFDNLEMVRWSEPITELFHRKGYSRVDFYGMATAKSRPQCSSVMFKGDCFLWKGNRAPARLGRINRHTV